MLIPEALANPRGAVEGPLNFYIHLPLDTGCPGESETLNETALLSEGQLRGGTWLCIALADLAAWGPRTWVLKGDLGSKPQHSLHKPREKEAGWQQRG